VGAQRRVDGRAERRYSTTPGRCSYSCEGGSAAETAEGPACKIEPRNRKESKTKSCELVPN
jgi:hypothetical protein